MELTLLPLAVMLLLLSGAGSRMPFAEGPSVSTGLIRLWLTGDKRQIAPRPSATNAFTKSFAFRIRDLQLAYQCSQVVLAHKARTESKKRQHSLLQGRFSVASAAYLSAAPPLA